MNPRIARAFADCRAVLLELGIGPGREELPELVGCYLDDLETAIRTANEPLAVRTLARVKRRAIRQFSRAHDLERVSIDG